MLQLLKKGPFFKKLPKTSNKRVFVIEASMPVTDGSEEVVKILYIYYLI